MQNLSVKVRDRDGIVVENSHAPCHAHLSQSRLEGKEERTDACAHEVLQDGTAESSSADDDDFSGLQLQLTCEGESITYTDLAVEFREGL